MSKLQSKITPLISGLIICLLLLACSKRTEEDRFLLLLEQRTDIPEAVYRIYSVQPDGSQLTELIEFNHRNVYWLSPDARHLALLTPWEDDEPNRPRHTLTVVNLLTGVTVHIPEVGRIDPQNRWSFVTEASIVWSPQGDKILFERNSVSGNGVDLWLYDLLAGSIVSLTEGESINWNPSWSPDGKQIAFTSLELCEEGTADCPIEERYWDIVVIDVDSKNRRIISDFRGSKLLPPELALATFCNLTWSADKRYIAFENQCSIYDTLFDAHEVFVARVDGGQVKQITEFPVIPGVTSHYNYSFTWSPLGINNLYVSYSRAEYLEPVLLSGGFVIADVESLQTIHSAEILGMAGRTASWSPDKKYVVVFTEQLKKNTRAMGPTLFNQLDEDGTLSILGVSSTLPYASCNETKSHWSPNGQYVAYTTGEQSGTCADEVDRYGIAVVSLSEGQATHVVEALAGDKRPIGWLVVNQE